MNEAARSRWDEFARRDPQYYIDPSLGPGASAQEFLEGGRGVVQWAVEWAGEIERDRALEIGCGVGRDTVHLARHFGEVDGVDISPAMVSAARARGLSANVRIHVLSGSDLKAFGDGTFTFVFSFLVFQHIAEREVIISYLHEIARVLAPGGVAALQFDTRRSSPLVWLAQRVPDPLLPTDRRRGIRRHRRSADDIRAIGHGAWLTLEAESAPDSALHWFRWRR